MLNRTLWDGREPITDALVRQGLRDPFQDALDEKNPELAARILCTIGADEQTAWEMVAVLIPTPNDEAS